MLKNAYAGDALQVSAVGYDEDTQITIEQPQSLPADVTVSAVSAFGMEQTYTLHIREQDAVYASDMTWIENESGYFANGRDTSDGSPIAVYVDGVRQTFDKGIGTHANARITLDVSELHATTIHSIVGINASQSPSGLSDVTFSVLVDGVEKYHQQVLAGESYPCEVDVRGAQTVTLVVDMNGVDYNDHASWADAKFTCDEKPQVPVEKSALNAAIEAAEALRAAITALEEADEPIESASDAAIAALQNMVDKASALGSDDAALNEAITNAQAVLDKETPSAAEVVTALLDLSEAMQALNAGESTDALRADLEATIDFINDNILTNVDNIRPAKAQALIDAVTAAQELLADEEAREDQLKAASRTLTKAAQELWEIVTKAELEALIESANGYLDGDCIAESIAALQDAITNAQAVADNDDATTSEVTNAITDLEQITLDTSALEHEIELAEAILANIDDYVPSTVEGLQEKTGAARAALEATTQEEIDAAAESLREARLNARTKADVSALQALIAAKRVAADEEATQDEVNLMLEQLQGAVNALEPVQESRAPQTDADKEGTAPANDDAAARGADSG